MDWHNNGMLQPGSRNPVDADFALGFDLDYNMHSSSSSSGRAGVKESTLCIFSDAPLDSNVFGYPGSTMPSLSPFSTSDTSGSDNLSLGLPWATLSTSRAPPSAATSHSRQMLLQPIPALRCLECSKRFVSSALL